MADFKTTYQPTQPQPVAPEFNPNKIHVREYGQGIWIPLWQNLFGGIGLCVFVSITHWLISDNAGNALETGVIVGGLLFGAATTFRAFSDEVLKIITAYGMKQDKATRAALEGQVKQYEQELKDLRSKGVIQDKYLALMAAERLLREHFEQGLDIHRIESNKRGWARSTWESGVKILRAAGVVNGKTDVLILTFPEAWAKVLHSQAGGMGSYVATANGDIVRVK